MTTEPMFNPPEARADADGRARHQAALATLLAEGQRFTEAPADPHTAEQLRGWLSRVQWAGRTLADYFEKPARTAVMTMLDGDGLPLDLGALEFLRANIAGASPEQLGDETGVTGQTIRRLETDTYGCNVSTAKRLADRFGLRVMELFDESGPRESFRPRSVGVLRTLLLDGETEVG